MKPVERMQALEAKEEEVDALMHPEDPLHLRDKEAERRSTKTQLRRASSSSLWASSSGRRGVLVLQHSVRHLHPALAVELFQHPLPSEREREKVGGGHIEINSESSGECTTSSSDKDPVSLPNNGPHVSGATPSSHQHHPRFLGPPGAERRWHLLVGALAMLDLVANGSWRYVGFWKVLEYESNASSQSSNQSPFRRPKFFRQWPTTTHTQSTSSARTADGTLVAWLALRRNSFGALFSMAWLIDALVVAATDSDSVYEEEEEKEEDREGVGANQCNGTGKQSPRRRTRRRKSAPWIRFLRILAVQLLLLPVGLYQGLFRRCGGSVSAPAWVKETWLSVGRWNDHNDKQTLRSSSAASYNRRSVAMVVFAGAATRVSKAVQALQLSGAARAQALLVRTVVSNLYRPRLLIKSILDVLRLIRWIRCLLPVAGAAGNLANRVRDLRKRRRQRRQAQEASRLRREELQRLPSQQVRERCAGRLQAAYRARQARRMAESLWQGDAEHQAALRLRKPLRASLVRARRRLCEKRRCVEWFRVLQGQVQAQEQHQELCAQEPPSLEDRKYLYRLERELRDEALWLLNRTLLVSPHSRFTAVWNAVMVAGAAVEIASLVLALSTIPSGGGGAGLGRSSAAHPPDTGNRAALREALARSLVPRRWDQSPPCRPDITCHYSRSRCALRRLLLLVGTGRATPVIALPNPPALPWYCAPTVARLQSCLSGALEVATPLGLRVLEAASGADVVVKVFTAVDDTGDPASEWLQPPPAFRRWILPGLLLQLLVNPQLEGIRGGLIRAGTLALEFGPYRVLGWTVAAVYPFVRWLAGVALQAWIIAQAGEMEEAVAAGAVMSSATAAAAAAAVDRAIIK